MGAASSKKAVVLFGHGARDPQWAEPMKKLQAMLQAQMPGSTIELAFLELMEPSLPDCVQALVQSGVSAVQVVPIFFGKGGHLKNDFPVILQGMKAEHPDVEILATSAVGQWDAVWQAIAEEIVKLAEPR